MLAIRLAIFPFFVAAIIYLARHFVAGDRRMKLAAVCAALTALSGGLSLVFGSGVPHDLVAAIKLVFLLGGTVLLGGALWVAIYVGMLLADEQGGFWTKWRTSAQKRDAVLWCGASLAALLLLTVLICRLSRLPVNAPSIVSVGSFLHLVFTLLTYSLAEEFYYRGCVQALLASWLRSFRWGGWCAIGVATVLFTAQHVDPNHQNILLLLVLPAGLVFGVIFARFGVVAAASVHFAANLLSIFLLPHLL